MIKGIVFDLDGTLVNTAKVLAEAWTKAFLAENINVDFNEIYKNTRGISSKEIIRKYRDNSNKEDMERIKNKRREDFLSIIKVGSSILYPETAEVLSKLRAMGVKTAIGTGMSMDLLPSVIKMTGLNESVDAVVSSDDVDKGKPFPDIFLEAFKRIGVIPTEGMVVGDSINDIVPGKKIGSVTVFISREHEKLEMSDININNLKEILDFL